jgi:hypothetical protein
MKKIFMVFMWFIIGCVTSEVEHKSNWYVLDKADKIDCQRWPKRDKDLRIESIKSDVDQFGLIRGFSITVLTRSANKAYYFQPFGNSPSLNLEDAQPLELPRRTILLGSINQGKRTYVLAAQNVTQGIQFELRNMGDNVVQSKTLLKGEKIDDGRIVRSVNSDWIRYTSPDGSDKIAQIQWLTKGQMGIRLVAGTYDSAAVLLAKSKGLFVLWKEEPANTFGLRWIPSDGVVGAPQQIQFQLDHQVESWTAGLDGDRIHLVVVDGDTLIGQAYLKVMTGKITLNTYNYNGIIKTVLKNVHATEPVVAKRKGQAEVHLMNWIDEESTIARYKIGENRLHTPSYAGVFPKGTKIQESIGGKEQSFFIAKNKIDSQWNFYLCEH